MNKDTFAKWLETHADLKPYSIGRYANAIDIISSELGNYGLDEINLFKVTDTTFIETILNNPNFKKRNRQIGNMYSAALNHFKRYIEQTIDKEFQDELLKEELEFEKYLAENPTDASKANIEDKQKINLITGQ